MKNVEVDAAPELRARTPVSPDTHYHYGNRGEDGCD